MEINRNPKVDTLINIQKKIIPDLLETLEKRYNILRLIHYNQPIGRRNLSNLIGIGERVVRGEVMILKEQGFIDIKAEGMRTTKFAETTIEILGNFMHISKGLGHTEEEIVKKLKIQKVLIVPRNYKEDDLVLREIGKIATNYLKSILREDMIIGITGGRTMAMIPEEIEAESAKTPNLTIVPARGGLGKEVEKQANTIAAKLAQKLNGNYKLLHMPDHVSKDVLDSLSENPEIKEVIDCIQNIQTLIFGIGRADKMTRRRGLNEEKIKELIKNEAVAEAFGYYFNKNGETVHEVNTVGVNLDHYKRLKSVIGAAAGEEKAEAIIAISRLNENLVLIIDEGLAHAILNIINKK